MAPYWINANDQYVNWGANQIVQRACGKFRREWESITPKNKNWTQINYPLIRYADVLLMLAEAENEANQGPTALAYEAVNIVRERAGIEPLWTIVYRVPTKFAARGGRELLQGRSASTISYAGVSTRGVAALGEATYDSRWPAGGNYSTARAFAERTQKKHEFLPIPLGELSINTELTQNPLW